MALEENLDDFKCALSSEDRHFIIEPILLIKCGHSVCKACLPNNSISLIKCKTCGVISEFDFRESKVSTALKKTMKYVYENMYQILETEMNSKLNSLKNISENQVELLDVKVKFIEDEIDVRIECIKDQLDIAREKLRNDLYKIKSKIEETISGNNLNKDDLSKYDSILKDLQGTVKNKVNLNEDGIDRYQKNIKELNDLIKKQDLNINEALDIRISNEIINPNVIGELLFLKTELDNNEVKDLLLNGKQEVFDLNFSPWEILVLPNNIILCSNNQDQCLTLYDENLKLIKKIDRLNGDVFRPSGIAMNEEDSQLFIVDQLKPQIITTDFEFKNIKTVGSCGSGDNQFESPYNVCYQSNKLYICDFGNKRIQIYNKDLEFVQSLKTKYGPWLMKVSNSLMFVQSGDSPSFYTYELKNLSLKPTCATTVPYCKISVIDSCFYRFNHQSKSFLFYDESGNFKEEIKMNNIGQGFNFVQEDGIIVELNGKILMSYHRGKKIIRFSKD